MDTFYNRIVLAARKTVVDSIRKHCIKRLRERERGKVDLLYVFSLSDNSSHLDYTVTGKIVCL